MTEEAYQPTHTDKEEALNLLRQATAILEMVHGSTFDATLETAIDEAIQQIVGCHEYIEANGFAAIRPMCDDAPTRKMRYLTEDEIRHFVEEFHLLKDDEENVKYPEGFLEYLLDSNKLNGIPMRPTVHLLFGKLLYKETIDKIYDGYQALIEEG